MADGNLGSQVPLPKKEVDFDLFGLLLCHQA